MAMSIPRVEYDRDADAAYVYLVEEIPSGAVARTVTVDPREVSGSIVTLDLDSENRIIGLEVLDASRRLSAELLGR